MNKPLDRRLKFRFVAVTYKEAFFEVVRRGMIDAAAAMNADCDFVGSTGVDADEMIALAREALDGGYDGIAIDIFDAAPFAPFIAEARGKGIPVVAFNIDAGKCSAGNLSYVMQDFSAAGRTLGTRASAHIPKGSTAIVTMHDAGISALEDRRDGIKEALAGHGLTWIECITGHEPEEAAHRIGEAVATNAPISAILGTGQADTEGAGLAARGKSGLYVAGFDMSPTILGLIDDGVIDCTIDQQPYTQGFYPVVQLALNVRYGIMPANLDAGAAMIDRSNVAQVRTLSVAGVR